MEGPTLAGLLCGLGIMLIVLNRPVFGIVCVGAGLAAWEIFKHANIDL